MPQPEIQRLTAVDRLRRRWRWVPKAAPAEGPKLFRQTLGLLQTSLAEGCGLPILEADGRGTQVVASPVPSALEAGGDAVWRVGPENAEPMVAGREKFAGDGPRRQAERARGREQAAEPCWRWGAIAQWLWKAVAAARRRSES